MRYKELLEFQSNDEIEPAANAAPEQSSSKVYFHVTTKHRLKSIQQHGIEPNHKRKWKTGFGNILGERGNIYLISDFDAAVRWAYTQQWEHYNGKEPAASPYIIISVRENPENLEPDPHPHNGLYGNTWFQKKGKIAPEDIMKVIPLTKALIQQVVKVAESMGMHGIISHWSRKKCLRALTDRGWYESDSTPGMFINSEYPEFYIDLDINSLHKPFTIYRPHAEPIVTDSPPTASQLALKSHLTDQPDDDDPYDFTRMPRGHYGELSF
jgi:hypothetical protein